MPGPDLRRLGAAGLLAALVSIASPASAALEACRIAGIEHEALCGRLERLLDPARPDGPRFTLHYAVLPAVARHKREDPVFVFAGGPGQSAIDLAPQIEKMLARLRNRRDVVLVDQRGTGRSAPLECDEDKSQPLADQVDPVHQLAQLAACRDKLQRLPYGDLRFYTTVLASADADAVRAALGVERINLVGASYGTRAALDYQRQFPKHVRRTVLDGVVPPDMVLPDSFRRDNAAAFEAVLASCEADASCKRRHPDLRAQWTRLLQAPPRDVVVRHPFTGRPETLRVTPAVLDALLRGPLYAPWLAAALPAAMAEAVAGRLEPLAALGLSVAGGIELATGMHFSVVCAEDAPRMTPAPADSFGALYAEACRGWPRAPVPADFYTVPPAATPVLMLSGGADPATPPRHGERMQKALGPKALHTVVPQAGHGLLALPCLRTAAQRFVEAETDEDALAVKTDCAAGVPRPPAFVPVTGEAAKP